MKLSTRSRYGLRALYELSCCPNNKPIAIKTIAAKQEISEAYLEQLFSLLRKANIIKSSRGAQGGYTLARNPEDISIGEVLLVLEGSTKITDCLDSSQCSKTCTCGPRPIFFKIQQNIDEVLNNMSIKDMNQEFLASANTTET